jgi:hypothetical protein
MQLKNLKVTLNFKSLVHYMFLLIWSSSKALKFMLEMLKFEANVKILCCKWDSDMRSDNKVMYNRVMQYIQHKSSKSDKNVNNIY